MEQLVSLYLAREKQDHENYLSSLRTTTDYICGQPNPPEAPAGAPYIFDNHQWHLRYPSRQPVVKTIAALWSCREQTVFTDFEELYAAVERIKQPYFGATCLYDFALRYGWNQQPRVVPDRYVYLHTKPLQTARKLLELGYIPAVGRRLPLENYSALLLPGMTAMDVEHFLCVFRKPIMRLKEKK